MCLEYVRFLLFDEQARTIQLSTTNVNLSLVISVTLKHNDLPYLQQRRHLSVELLDRHKPSLNRRRTEEGKIANEAIAFAFDFITSVIHFEWLNRAIYNQAVDICGAHSNL